MTALLLTGTLLLLGAANGWVVTPTVSARKRRVTLARTQLHTVPFGRSAGIALASEAGPGQGGPGSSTFDLGDEVRCCWPAQDGDYLGRIAQLYGDGTYGVHYLMDDSFEGGVTRDRLTLARDAPDSGFQQQSSWDDELPDETDEELLAVYRAQQIEANDNFQFSEFAGQSGEWFGLVQRWQLQPDLQLAPVTEGADASGFVARSRWLMEIKGETILDGGRRAESVTGVDRSMRIVSSTVQGGADEALLFPGFDAEAAGEPEVAEFLPSSLRPDLGNQACGQTFTRSYFVSGDEESADDIIHELALREENCRVRLRVQYAPSSVLDGAVCRWRLRVVDMFKEKLDAFPTADDFVLKGPRGTGIYDGASIPARDDSNYQGLFADGKVTAVVPIELMADRRGAVVLDWAPSNSRYQVDRIFTTGQGTALQSLELTEALVDPDNSEGLEMPRP